MIEHKGIDHLTKLVAFAVVAVGAVKKANEDGKINWRDALTLWPAMRDAPAAFKDIGELPKEIIDLDPVEAEELVKNIEGHFGDLLPAGRTQDVVDAALGCLPSLANLYMTIANPPPHAPRLELAS